MAQSIGALTDDRLFSELSAAAEASGSRLILCTGSLPAVDWMGAAALAGCGDVSVTQTKPPAAWFGTPAEKEHDLAALTSPTLLFEGSARRAAALYPKNANVAAMYGLATAGLDGTTVRLVADPAAASNQIDLAFEGPAGRCAVSVQAAPSPSNPRTSAVVALSVIKAMKKLTGTTLVGL